MHDRIQDPAADGWESLSGSGFPEAVGQLWFRREGEAGRAYGLLTDSRHNNGRGVVHGGILATIIDHALGNAVHRAVRPHRCATIHLDLHYLAPANPGEFVEARTEVVRRTRSIVFVRGQLSVAGRPVLSASGIWKVLDSSRTSEGGMA